MSANIETMVYTGETPWHGLGIKQDDLMTVDEAFDLTMNWMVREQGLYVANPDTDKPQRVPGYKAIVRDSDNQVLAVMGENYKTFQNADMADFFKKVIGPKHSDTRIIETAGSLAKGKKVWLLAKLNGVIRSPLSADDIVEQYLLTYTSHDGSLAHSILPTGVRVVCQNTLEAAREGAKGGIKVRHTANMEEKVREAQRALKLSMKAFDSFQEEVNVLAKARFSEKQMKDLAANLFPATPVQKNGVIDTTTEHVSARSEEAREKLIYLFENGHGQETCRGTAWAALNAVTEFTDHYRSTRVTGGERDETSVREARLQSIWFGASRDMKAEAREFIHETIAA